MILSGKLGYHCSESLERAGAHEWERWLPGAGEPQGLGDFQGNGIKKMFRYITQLLLKSLGRRGAWRNAWTDLGRLDCKERIWREEGRRENGGGKKC